MDSIGHLAAAPAIVVAGLLVFTAVSDVRRYLIPNWISIGIALAFVPFAALSPLPIDWLGSLITAAAALAVGFALFSLRVMGGGDVKLIAACALWAGPGLIAPFLLLVSIAGGVLAIGLMIGRAVRSSRRPGASPAAADRPATPLMRQKIPYGVAIAAGGIVLIAHQLSALGFTL
jgi:prepilin peptidase CpaA